MGETVKIAVTAPVQVGGSLFTPAQLALIGSLAADGAGIEMTPFRQFYVQVEEERRQEISEALERSGLEVYGAGFVVKNLIACNFCKGAEDAGLETAKRLNRAIAGSEAPMPLKVGYAGCALGTSEPLLKDIGVVKKRDVFDIYVGGEPKGIKAATAKLLASGLPEDRLVPAVTAIIAYYKAHAKGKEKFAKFVDRVSLETLRQLV